MNSLINNLFRKEVVEAQKTRWMGDIILARPFSFTLLTVCTACIALLIITFSVFGSYTKRSTVQGQLIPQSGLIRVYSTEQGIIVNKNVYEGEKVKQGDVLYTISTAQYGENGNIQAALSQQTKLKEQSIQNEISRTKLAQESEKNSILNQIELLNAELQQNDTLLKNQQQRIALSKANQQRYEIMVKQDAASHEELELRKIDYLDQMAKYQSLQREKLTLQKQLQEQRISLNGLQHKQKSQLDQLERLLSSNTQELIEMQSRQSIVIRANQSGVVSTINAELGQFIDLSKPLLSILPENTTLIAQLYVPSRAIGFVKEGDQVLLRYQAYPYQKFGHAKAQVISVAKTALAGQELGGIGIISPQEQMNNEPMYLVRVKLAKQNIRAYGQDMPLQVGMILEGDIMHEKRRLYEWVLEPLFSITGKL